MHAGTFTGQIGYQELEVKGASGFIFASSVTTLSDVTAIGLW